MSIAACVSVAPVIEPILGPASELEHLGDEIAKLSAHLDAATAHLLDLIREFDARGGWGNGFRSCAHWLSWRVGLEPGAAREHVRVARALGSLPGLAQALARGELSYSKVRALSRVATPETEERLLAVGRAGTAEHVELIVRGWRRMDRKAEAQETTRRHRNRALHVYPDGDGMVMIHGRLEPEIGALVMQALTAAREALYRRRQATEVPGGTSVVDRSPEAPTMEQQQGRRARPRRRDDAASRHRSRSAGRALSGRCSRRRRRARQRRCAGSIRARRRRTRSRGNVSAPGVRCESRGDATRFRGSDDRGRRPHAYDSPGVTPSTPASRSRLSLPRLRAAVRARPSHPALGAGRPDDAVQPRDALPSTPSRGSRRGLSGGAIA